MKILFLYPGLKLGGRYRDIIKGVTVPPQGLCQIAAITRQMGHKTKIIDAVALDFDFNKTITEINKFSPDILGISSTTMQIETAARVAGKIKDILPKTSILVGGPHITVTAEDTMSRFSAFDIGFLGEAEMTIKEYLCLYPDGDFNSVPGLIFRSKEGLVRTKQRQFIKNLDDLPMPAWDLLPNLKVFYQQSVARVDKVPAVSVTTSRGCPYHCIFCARNVFGSSFRAHSAGYVMKMIDLLIKDYGVRSLSFEDENFIVDRKRLEAICKEFIKRKLKISWGCVARVDLTHSQDLKQMKEAGCTNISFGIESGSQKILDILGKSLTLDKIEKGVRMTSSAGIRPRGYFIIGSPGETLETIQETINFVKRIPFAEVQMSFMCPFPGTELYGRANMYGTFDNDWPKLNIWTPVFIPAGLTKETLIRESKRFYRSFYFRPGPILAYLKRTLNPAYTVKYIKDGLNIFRFILNKN